MWDKLELYHWLPHQNLPSLGRKKSTTCYTLRYKKIKKLQMLKERVHVLQLQAYNYSSISSGSRMARSKNVAASSSLAAVCWALLLASSPSFTVISVLTISGVRLVLLSSMILPARLKADSDDTVETRTDNTSRANIESTGYVSLWLCHHCSMLNSTSSSSSSLPPPYGTRSLLRYFASSPSPASTGDVRPEEVEADCLPKILLHTPFPFPELGTGGGHCRLPAYFSSYLP